MFGFTVGGVDDCGACMTGCVWLTCAGAIVFGGGFRRASGDLAALPIVCGVLVCAAVVIPGLGVVVGKPNPNTALAGDVVGVVAINYACDKFLGNRFGLNTGELGSVRTGE